ncbi:hypothetical protein GCM10009641_72360 [Mycobacterium cookii]|uniref:Uncharacterized protein n=1 Tax=Mycobacterium cookii TaxID=1775 RepID=A0A7I7KS24_9MYCO|nr:hypothetical protein [Mycobacterium cookii]MCV7330161.1 hypothetical protein [Mycobacterium cookii]BBX44208.1 hypothetical protein MCOO_02230 [Mycobacterium cookii]
MNAATKRTALAAGAVAAAGLFGTLSHVGMPQAQQGVPVEHHDVALVDVTDATLLLDESTLNTALFNDVLGPTGAEATLYNDLATALGATQAGALLDVGTANPIYSGDFNGAESRAFEALFIDALITEDKVNQLLGVTETASQTAILADFVGNAGPGIPAGAGVTLGDLTAALGTPSFDTDLGLIGNADFSLAATDLEGYLASLAGDTGALGGLTTLLTDLSSSFSDLSNLSTDISTLLSDIGSLGGLGGLLGGLGGLL